MNRHLVRAYKRKAYLFFVTNESTASFEVQYQPIRKDSGKTLISNMETKTFNCELATSGHNTNCLWEVTKDTANSDYYVRVKPQMINFPSSRSSYKTYGESVIQFDADTLEIECQYPDKTAMNGADTIETALNVMKMQ